MPVGHSHGWAIFKYFPQLKQTGCHRSQRSNQSDNEQHIGLEPYALVAEFQAGNVSHGCERPTRNRKVHQGRMYGVSHFFLQCQRHTQQCQEPQHR